MVFVPLFPLIKQVVETITDLSYREADGKRLAVALVQKLKAHPRPRQDCGLAEGLNTRYIN
jgi:hypothetical protein